MDSTEFEPVQATETAQPPVSDGNDEFPVPFDRFAATLQHTHDEVYVGLLRAQHGRENHKISEWKALLDQKRDTPAHEHHPNFAG